MTKKRKISVRRILQVFVTLVATTGCVIAITGASNIQEGKKLAGIDIRIRNSQYHFVDKQQVQDMLLNDRNINLEKLSLRKLDANQMENIINSNPWVAGAQVYVDNKRQLHVSVTQRVPVARVFEQNGNSYYLDHTLTAMPLSDKYIHYTTVVTNVPVLKDDSGSNALRAKIVALVKYIDRDSFWNAQISQVIVTDDRTFELVPVLGNHKIIFGDTLDMADKFSNLFAFYKKVMNRVGWDKYEVVNVSYAGQIVASPALPWKKPTDNAMSNMNWVKTIISNDPKAAQPDMPAFVAVVPAAAKNDNVQKAPEKPKAETKPAAEKKIPAPVLAKPVTLTKQPAQKPEPKKAVPGKKVQAVTKTAVPTKQPVKKEEPKKTVAEKKVQPAPKPVATVKQPVKKAEPKKTEEKKVQVAAKTKPPPQKPVQKAETRKTTEEKKMQAAAKPVRKDKEEEKEQQAEKEKHNNEKTPKYLYQGNH